MRFFAQSMAIVFLGVSISISSIAAETGTRSFHADLTVDEETALVSTKATGTADFTVDLSNMRVFYRVTFKDLTSNVTGIHLHGPVPMGNNAPAFFDLAPNRVSGTASHFEGSGTLTESQFQYMLIHEAYINIQTRKFPEGEVRGQLERVPDQPLAASVTN